MDATLALIISVILIVVIFHYAIKLKYQAKKLGLLNFLLWPFLFFLLLFALEFSKLAPLSAVLEIDPTNWLGANLLAAQATWLALLVYALLEIPEDRHVKTLIRVPIIGLLIGWYLGEKSYVAGYGLEVLGLLLLWRQKLTHRYLWRAQLKSFLLAIIASLALWWDDLFNVSVTLFLLLALNFKLPAISAIILKKMTLNGINANRINTNESENIE